MAYHNHHLRRCKMRCCERRMPPIRSDTTLVIIFIPLVTSCNFLMAPFLDPFKNNHTIRSGVQATRSASFSSKMEDSSEFSLKTLDVDNLRQSCLQEPSNGCRQVRPWQADTKLSNSCVWTACQRGHFLGLFTTKSEQSLTPEFRTQSAAFLGHGVWPECTIRQISSSRARSTGRVSLLSN